MSTKHSCPSCQSYTSALWEVLQGDGTYYADKCPNCGLPGNVIREVEAVRKARADADLTARLETALMRAGKAEGELLQLRSRHEEIRRLAKRIADGCPGEDDD